MKALMKKVKIWITERLRKMIAPIKEWSDKIIFRIKLWEMDDWWYNTGGSCWGLFPPSFYYTHTEEEIERITKETRARIQDMIDKLGD